MPTVTKKFSYTVPQAFATLRLIDIPVRFLFFYNWRFKNIAWRNHLQRVPPPLFYDIFIYTSSFFSLNRLPSLRKLEWKCQIAKIALLSPYIEKLQASWSFALDHWYFLMENIRWCGCAFLIKVLLILFLPLLFFLYCAIFYECLL